MPKAKTRYGRKFFKQIGPGSYASAQKIVPIILNLFQIRSVADVGCGAGAWLKSFKEFGVEEILGMDGNQTDILEIPKHQFIRVNLTKPFPVRRRFDLAISLEVAEHLPSKASGNFVKSLTRLAPVVLFSAAAPGQGGVHHVNEQWPEYWAQKFKREGYLPFDFLRRKIWNDRTIKPWYRQNLILFVDEKFALKNPSMKNRGPVKSLERLRHPELVGTRGLIENSLAQIRKKPVEFKVRWNSLTLWNMILKRFDD